MGRASAVTTPSGPRAGDGLLPAGVLDPAATATTPRSGAPHAGSDSSESEAVTGSADIGRSIRRERLASGITQAELARRINVSRQWVVRLEQGRGGQGVHRVLRALAVVGLELYATMPEQPT